MGKYTRPPLNQRDFEIQEFPNIPDVDSGIKLTIAHLVIYDDNSKKYRLVKGDKYGNINVVNSTIAWENVTQSAVSVGLVDVQILANNDNRKILRVFNSGANVVYFGFGQTATIANGVPIVTPSNHNFDGYTGELRAIAAAAPNTILIITGE